MLVDTNELPRERRTWMGKLYALDAAIYRSSPVLFFILRPILHQGARQHSQSCVWPMSSERWIPPPQATWGER